MSKQASLPMYNLPEMQDSNEAFWQALRERIAARGLDAYGVDFDPGRRPVPDGIGSEVLLTQICGYPLFKHFRGQGIMLATPCYAMRGCEGPNHSAFFMVRIDEPGQRLEDFRGRVFGCNSLKSNSGMNLPRLSLARIAKGRPLFREVLLTGGHVQSLERLIDGTIDLCSIDCVTWGFIERFRPELAKRVRVLEATVPSPSLPFATAAATPSDEVAVLRAALDDLFGDPGKVAVCAALAITRIEHLPDSAYAILASYEDEATALGYPEIR